jgi:glycosyltransferase involved in cell wall biosynthesis
MIARITRGRTELMPGPRSVAVMVTHNGARHLRMQLDSMLRQTVPLDLIVVLDDASTDETLDILAEYASRLPVEVHELGDDRRVDVGRAGAGQVASRIGQNFRLALEVLDPRDDDVVLLADQDDVWARDRVEHQSARLRRTGADVSAADALLIDDEGSLGGDRLSTLYPRPLTWESMDVHERLRAVLQSPVSTGAATAVTGRFLQTAPEVPAMWLHDRWLSLAAAARGTLDLDPRTVISYRLHAMQAVGSSGAGRRAAFARFRAWTATPAAALRRLRTIAHLRRGACTPRVRRELDYARLMVTMLSLQKWTAR